MNIIFKAIRHDDIIDSHVKSKCNLVYSLYQYTNTSPHWKVKYEVGTVSLYRRAAGAWKWNRLILNKYVAADVHTAGVHENGNYWEPTGPMGIPWEWERKCWWKWDWDGNECGGNGISTDISLSTHVKQLVTRCKRRQLFAGSSVFIS